MHFINVKKCLILKNYKVNNGIKTSLKWLTVAMLLLEMSERLERKTRENLWRD